METGFPLSGEYMLVAKRRAFGVAAPLSPEPPSDAPQDSVSFGLDLRWLGGRECGEWLPVRFNGIPFDMGDPNLSDVIVGPLGDRPDRRSNLLFQIICDGEMIASLVVVDITVAIVWNPNGADYAVLALRPSEDLVGRIQDRLKEERFYDGDRTGVLDEKTRAAAAAYAEHRGAAYRFANPVMSLNLIEGLDVFDTQ